MWASVKEKFGPFKVNSEGRTKYMYCDKNGNVTVGVGNMIDTTEKALKLTWHVRSTDAEASAQQVIDGHAASLVQSV